MIKAELISYGMYDTLKDIRETLRNALGDKCNKHRKDEAICQALGALDAIWNMVRIYEDDDDCEAESKE